MGIKIVVINMLQELLYFDIWESAIFLIIFLIDNKIKISKLQFIFHAFMISILDLIVSNIIMQPILRLLVLILIIGIYFSFNFKIKIIKGIISSGKSILIFLIIEAGLDILYGYFIHIELLHLQNNFKKFIVMIPTKIVEFIFIKIYYKMKGGEYTYEKNSKNYN